MAAHRRVLGDDHIRKARLGPDHPESFNSMSHLVELRRQPQELEP